MKLTVRATMECEGGRQPKLEPLVEMKGGTRAGKNC